MAKVEGITGFFEYIGAKARYFDIGRRIQSIPKAAFTRADLLQAPYPFPYLQHAWLGVVFWSEGNEAGANKTGPMVWSLKLPLDEQGLLQPEQRDNFLQQLLLTIGSNIQAAQAGERLQAVLDNNPYAFTLPEDRQAAFHAKVSHDLKRPPSQFYGATVAYFNSPSAHGWQDLGIQGLADVAARWQDNIKLLQNAAKAAPVPAIIGLSQLLEHEKLSVTATQPLVERLYAELKEETPNGALVAAVLRGISLSQAIGLRREALLKTMALLPKVEVEVVAAIASRCTNDLADQDIAVQFLELLAKLGHDNFIQVISDLMSLPELRPHLMQALRHPKRSSTLLAAIGALFAKIESS